MNTKQLFCKASLGGLCLIISIFLVSCSSEKSKWEEVKAKNTISTYEDFLKQYPQGEFADSARSMIKSLSVGTITGFIHGANTGEPLADAHILLCRLPEQEGDDCLCTLQSTPTVQSEASGSFTLSGVPTGKYILMYGMPDELTSSPEEWSGVKIFRAKPCMKNMKNAVCQSPEAPESIFWQDGGTIIGEVFSKFAQTNAEVDSAPIGMRFTGKVGGIYTFQGAVRSNQTGISLMISEGKLAPVVHVKPGETTGLKWQVMGR